MTKFIEAKLDKDWNWTTTHKFNGVNVWVCSDSGSILYIPSENIVGVVNTWPISVTNNVGELHWPTDWKTIGDDKITNTPAYSYQLADGTLAHVKPETDTRKGYKFKNAVQFAMKYENDYVNNEAMKAIN